MFRRSSSNDSAVVTGSRLSRQLGKSEDTDANDVTCSSFEVLLEKKGRARGAIGLFSGRPWAIRTFKLRKQILRYYDRDELRGEIYIAGAKCVKLEPSMADQKPFPFEIQCVSNERVILNASCEDVRRHCLEVLSLAATNVNWKLPEGMPAGESSSSSGIESSVKVDNNHYEGDEGAHTLWFYQAVNEGSVEEVKEVFEKYEDSIDVDFLSPEDGQTPLTSACYRNNLDIVKFLLEKCHALVNRPNYYGITALMLAVNFNRFQLVEYLINFTDCNVDLLDQNGESAYSLAENEDVKKMILARSNRADEYLQQNKSRVVITNMDSTDNQNSDTKSFDREYPVVSTIERQYVSHPLEILEEPQEKSDPLMTKAEENFVEDLNSIALAIHHGELPIEKIESEDVISSSGVEEQILLSPENHYPVQTSQAQDVPERPNLVLIEGIPENLYAAYLQYCICNSENKFNEAMKARNLPMAKQYSQVRDEAKQKMSDISSSNCVIIPGEFMIISEVVQQKQWLEDQIQNFIEELWSSADMNDSQKFETIEKATNFLETRLLGFPDKKVKENNESNIVWINSSMLTLPTDDDGYIYAADASIVIKDGAINQRIPVNVRLSLHEGYAKLENEFQLLSHLFAQSAKVVIKPVAFLSGHSDVLSSTDNLHASSNKHLRSSVSEDETTALGSYIALVTVKHEGNLRSYVQSRSTTMRYGERLMIVESIIDIVLVTHNCGFCLLYDLNAANLVKSNQSSLFVLGSLLHTVRFGQKVTPLRVVASYENSQYWSFEMARQYLKSSDYQNCIEAKHTMDLCVLGWIIWLVMGGRSLWEQRGIDCTSSTEVIQCLATISDEEIQKAIFTAFPQENKSSLRRLLSDLLATDPTKRCDLSSVYDDYAFFGRSDVDTAEELANALKRENSLRLAAEMEAAELERRKNLHIQEIEASKASLSTMIQAMEKDFDLHPTHLETIFAQAKAIPSVPDHLIQLLQPVVTHISKEGENLDCSLQSFSRTLSSILNFQLDDVINLRTSIQKVRNELKNRGNCLPYLFCMLPAVNYSASAMAPPASQGRLTGASRLMQQFKHLYWNRSKLAFICPVTLRVMQSGRSREGYQLDPPEQWIADAAPLLKLGILFLKLSLLTQDHTLIPKHFQVSIGDLDAVLEMLNAVRSEEGCADRTLGTSEFSNVIMTLFELIGREEGVDVHKLFSTWRLQRTGLTFTTCVRPRKTSSAWVSEDGRGNFEESGEDAFLI